MIEWAKAKVCVFADSVLCLGKVEQGSRSRLCKLDDRFKISNGILRAKTQRVLMEHPLNSGGEFSRNHFGSSHFGSRFIWLKTFVAHAQRSGLVVTFSVLRSRWFACVRQGPVRQVGVLIMSQPHRSARLALQRERAESRPVEPVSIPLDDDTDSLVSVGVAATCAVCGECSSGNMVRTSHVVIMLLIKDAFTMAFAHSAVQTCPMQWTLLQCSLASSVVSRWSWTMSCTFSLVVPHGAICDAWLHVCQQLVRKFLALIALLSPATT